MITLMDVFSFKVFKVRNVWLENGATVCDRLKGCKRSIHPMNYDGGYLCPALDIHQPAFSQLSDFQVLSASVACVLLIRSFGIFSLHRCAYRLLNV